MRCIRHDFDPRLAGVAARSLQSDLPMNRLQELFNVNYFIVSQTNPHAIPFVQRAQRQAVRRQVPGCYFILYCYIIS